MHLSRNSLSLFATCALLAATAVSATDSAPWPSFRGPGAEGLADGAGLPTSWSPESGSNVRWRTEIPGNGHSSPVIAGGRVYVTTAVPLEEGTGDKLVLGDDGGIDVARDRRGQFSWRLVAVDAASGEVAWQKEAYSGKPRADRHVKSSQANSTPATDGQRVAAIFGSQGLVVFDAASGEEKWRTDLGVLDPGLFGDSTSQWGYASSPLLHEGQLFVQVDRHADSYIAAYDAETGKRQWRVRRQEKPVWATPTLHVGEERSQLIVLGGDYDRGLEPATGKELWRFRRDEQVKTPTPFVAGDRIVISGGYRGKPVYAVDLGAEGGVSNDDDLLWTSEEGGPYTSTPVAYDGKVFFVRDTGVFTVLDLESGETLHRRRTGDRFSASPIASDGHLYFPSEGGTVHVVSTKAPYDTVATVDMPQPCMASPAVAGKTLYLRCGSELWAIGEG